MDVVINGNTPGKFSFLWWLYSVSVIHSKYPGVIRIVQCQVVAYSMWPELVWANLVCFNLPPVTIIHVVLVSMHIQKGVQPMIIVFHN